MCRLPVVARMGRPVAEVTLTEEQRETLLRWSRRANSAQALALRCRIVLGCALSGSRTWPWHVTSGFRPRFVRTR